MNGDGKADAVSITSGMVYVALSTGTAFGPTYTYWGSAGPGPRYYVADANGDGKADVISGSSNASTWTTALSTGTSVSGVTTSYNVFVISPSTKVAVGDFNGDHSADLLTGYQGTQWASVGLGGTFGRYKQVGSGSGQFGSAAGSFLTDLNYDGRADAVSASTSGTWTVQLSLTSSYYSTPSFGSPSTWASGLGGGTNTKYLIADVNGDNRADAIAQTDGVWSVAIAGSGSFGSPQTWSKGFVPPTSSLPTTLLAGDASGDAQAEPVSVTDGTWRVGGGGPIPDQIKAGGGGYTQRMNDNFDPTSTPVDAAASNWRSLRSDPELGGVLPGTTPYSSLEGATYRPSQNVYADGAYIETIRSKPADANGDVYETDSINTFQKFRFTYGYVEARIKVPKCAGCFPAFWMMPIIRHRPPEIDIFEYSSQVSAGLLPYSNNHWMEVIPPATTATEQQHSVAANTLSDYTGDFHIYGMLWTSTSLQFFVDGVAQPVITKGIPQEDMYLIATMQQQKCEVTSDGSYLLPPPAVHKCKATTYNTPLTPTPPQMAIDYIRVWRNN
jgi:hypothetical protein